MQTPNTILEDLCVDIGFTATNRLVCWFGGAYLRVPGEIAANDPIAKALGLKAAVRLAAGWGGRRLWIPLAHGQIVDRRDRQIADELLAGRSCGQIAVDLGLTARRVEQIRLRLKREGLLEIAAENGREKEGVKTPLKKGVEKTPTKNPREKRP